MPDNKDELRAIPMINGLDCPACGHPCLMLGSGGYITCAYIDCPNPDYAEAITTHNRNQLKSLKAKIQYERENYKLVLSDNNWNEAFDQVNKILDELIGEK